MRAGVFHRRKHAGGAGARPCAGRQRIAVPPMQGIKVARLVARIDRHAEKARLLQIEHTRRAQLLREWVIHVCLGRWTENAWRGFYAANVVSETATEKGLACKVAATGFEPVTRGL